jgi:hypothetical protein
LGASSTAHCAPQRRKKKLQSRVSKRKTKKKQALTAKPCSYTAHTFLKGSTPLTHESLFPFTRRLSSRVINRLRVASSASLHRDNSRVTMANNDERFAGIQRVS